MATIFNTKVLRLMTLTCILYLKELRVEHPCGLVAALLSASTQVSNFVGRRSIAGRPLVSRISLRAAAGYVKLWSDLQES